MRYITFVFLSLLPLTWRTSITASSFSNASTSTETVEKGKATSVMIESSIQSLYNTLAKQAPDLPYDAFRYAVIGYYNFTSQEKFSIREGLLSIIDYTAPSTQKRFYTIDLKQKKILLKSYVSHGKNTGENMAKSFSNRVHSNQSSMGFYLTGETYVGSKGYSLKLDGMESDYNSNMRKRAVVMHEAAYVSENWIKRYGRLGRSQGCPAFPTELSRKIIDTIKNKTLVFGYFNDNGYLSSSLFLGMSEINAEVLL